MDESLAKTYIFSVIEAQAHITHLNELTEKINIRTKEANQSASTVEAKSAKLTEGKTLLEAQQS